MREEELAQLVADLRAHPDDEAVRMILADALDEAGATPVDPHRIPEWLRLAWVRCRPRDAQRFRGSPAGWAVALEVGAWLGQWPGVWPRWDHWGTTTIAGLACLVSEPYCRLDEAPWMFEPLYHVIPGAAPAFARESAWGHGTYRGLLLPPLVMPRSRRRRQVIT
jgi:uncharacterized protein (TIGR02996 family)